MCQEGDSVAEPLIAMKVLYTVEVKSLKDNEELMKLSEYLQDTVID